MDMPLKKKPSAKITSHANELTKSFAPTHVLATPGGTLTYIPYTLTGLHTCIDACMHAYIRARPQSLLKYMDVVLKISCPVLASTSSGTLS